MDAIIGRYKVGLKETGLTLKHEAGISFELTIEETLGFITFLNVYHETLLALKDENEPETQKIIRVVIDDAKDEQA
jgi:hypothetical protein